MLWIPNLLNILTISKGSLTLSTIKWPHNGSFGLLSKLWCPSSHILFAMSHILLAVLSNAHIINIYYAFVINDNFAHQSPPLSLMATTFMFSPPLTLMTKGHSDLLVLKTISPYSRTSPEILLLTVTYILSGWVIYTPYVWALILFLGNHSSAFSTCHLHLFISFNLCQTLRAFVSVLVGIILTSYPWLHYFCWHFRWVLSNTWWVCSSCVQFNHISFTSAWVYFWILLA